mmetsp:Transcript_16641/g.34330  ORF Transcript_16641/g.34330 Transcript_16641/m.34330 type:complete len:238 (-) Transcript_16641:323-1036(-)
MAAAVAVGKVETRQVVVDVVEEEDVVVEAVMEEVADEVVVVPVEETVTLDQTRSPTKRQRTPSITTTTRVKTRREPMKQVTKSRKERMAKFPPKMKVVHLLAQPMTMWLTREAPAISRRGAVEAAPTPLVGDGPAVVVEEEVGEGVDLAEEDAQVAGVQEEEEEIPRRIHPAHPQTKITTTVTTENNMNTLRNIITMMTMRQRMRSLTKLMTQFMIFRRKGRPCLAAIRKRQRRKPP